MERAVVMAYLVIKKKVPHVDMILNHIFWFSLFHINGPFHLFIEYLHDPNHCVHIREDTHETVFYLVVGPQRDGGRGKPLSKKTLFISMI